MVGIKTNKKSEKLKGRGIVGMYCKGIKNDWMNGMNRKMNGIDEQE
jgi:hypothetical protein